MFNNAEMHILSFGSHFEMFSCFVLGKCSVNCPQAGRTAEDDKWAGNLYGMGVYYRWNVYSTVLLFILVLTMYIWSQFYILV